MKYYLIFFITFLSIVLSSMGSAIAREVCVTNSAEFFKNNGYLIANFSSGITNSTIYYGTTKCWRGYTSHSVSFQNNIHNEFCQNTKLQPGENICIEIHVYGDTLNSLRCPVTTKNSEYC